MNDLVPNNVGTGVGIGGSWGAESADSRDILIPAVLLMHELSDIVKKNLARPGNLVHSTTQEVLAKGDAGEVINFIPIVTFKEWIENTVTVQGGKDREKFKRKLKMTRENEDWPLEEVVEGEAVRRFRSMSFMVLLTSQIGELPFMLSFRKSNYREGQKLSTHFSTCGRKGLPPASQTWDLGSSVKTWDGFTFQTLTLKPSRQTTADELAAARTWYDVFAKANIKADEGEETPF